MIKKNILLCFSLLIATLCFAQKDSSALHQYKLMLFNNGVNYFSNKQFDSLKTIFPEYQKFIPQLRMAQNEMAEAEPYVELTDMGSATDSPFVCNVKLVVNFTYNNQKRQQYLLIVDMGLSDDTDHATITSFRIEDTIFAPMTVNPN